MMSSVARRATPADIPVLVDMMGEFYAEADYPLDRGWAAGAFAHLLANLQLGAAWLFLDDSVPAGYVVLTLRFSMEYGGLDGFIDDLYVRPDHRRRGLARRGLLALIAHCERNGVAALHVIVGDDNLGARALYSGFGMEAPTDGRLMLTARLDPRPAGLNLR